MGIPLRTHLLAAALLSVPTLVRSQEMAPPEHYKLRLEYVRWFPSLTGELQKGAGDVPGTLVDLKDDLGIEDHSSNELKAVLRLGGRAKLRAAYTPLDYDGDVIASRPFLFDGTFFRKDAQTVTSLKGALWSGDFGFDVLRGGWGYLGLLVGARVLDVDAVIVQPTEGRRETGTLQAPVPVLGVSGRLYVGRISLSAEISGLTIGSRGTLYDAEGHARYHLTDRLAVGGGFRLLSVRGEDGNDFIKLRDQGARVVLELSL